MQRSRNRRRCQRQDVDLRLQTLEPLLLADAEALLLIDDDEPEIGEAHVCAEQPVGPDDHVEFSAPDGRDGRALVLRALKSVQTADAQGERAEPPGEGQEVLLNEHGGGREDGARGAANSGGTAPDTTKWNWVPCENRPELLTYHDGKKRWFHCSKCEYWNDRLYHTKMHYERIHVKQGYVPDARALFHL